MRFSTVVLLTSLSLAACAGSDADTDCDDVYGKPSFDIEENTSVLVTIAGDLAFVDCPLSCTLPDQVADSEVEAELNGKVTLTIDNNATGMTVNLNDAQLVEGEPQGPNEFSYEVNAERNNVRVLLWNNTPTGQRLRVGGDYTALLGISPNDYINPISPPVSVTPIVQ